MASYHPGVKSLIDRIMKQQPSNNKKNEKDKVENNGMDIAKILDHSNEKNRLGKFKDILKQRMKEKRQRQREEEKEEDEVDEEFHFTAKDKDKDSENSNQDSNKDENDDEENDEDYEEEEDDGNEEDNQSDNSDTNFKLNLDDDDDEDDQSHYKQKKDSKYGYYGIDSAMNNEIPASIPSNQLTSNSSISIKQRQKKDIYDFDDNDENEDDDDTNTQFRLYINTNDDNKQQDDIDDISINLDTTANNSSLNNNQANSSLTATQKLPDDNDTNPFGGDDAPMDFDELAMLCSGRFKDDENNVKKTQVTNKEIAENVNKSSEVNDVKNDDVNIEKVNNDSDDGTNKKLDKSDSSENNVDEEDEIRKKKDKPVNELLNDDNDSIFDCEDREIEEVDDVVADSDDGSDENKIKNPKVDFFEQEAELSGSEEGDSDEHYDGESDDDNIVCSGDEDQVPSDEELKDQLEQIYLKDQIDQDKRELRVLKEMYLEDGEMHQEKDFRKKQFRWKNFNDNRVGNPFSSDEEEDDDDEQESGGENEEEKELNISKNISKFKKGKIFKSLTNNWRTNRHEREQFLDSQKNKDDLASSDDENSKFDDDTSQSGTTNQLLQIGQNLLKNKQKRTFHEISKTETTIKDSDIEIIKTTTTEIVAKSSDENNVSYLEKFSFLKKDKTYLSRLSSYVSKTINVNNAGGSANGNSNVKKSRNMVFACLSQAPTEEVSNENDVKPKPKEYVAVQEPLPKRAKFDSNNAESIFNHL